ncbi:MAG: LeoA/HP0731 family dynamin-like GTPase [Candidatus Vecturithrix sp.]|nr:LeoA/HP0731 family dynamin-like GTPase [Candidatus Vecturithrix sp.]
MMVITEELKAALIEEINEDAAFGYDLFRAIIRNAEDRIVTAAYLDQALARQSEEINERFKQVDRRFEQVDRRFEQVDRRFEQVDRRFEQVDQRLDQVDQRLDQVDQRLDQVDQRLNQVDQRLNQVDQRFDQLDLRIESVKEELKQFIDRKLGYIGSRWGEDIENTYRNFAQTIVAQWSGTVTKWKRTVKATDEQGSVLKLPYEIDVIVVDSRVMLIECKSKCDLDDVERFIENIQQYERLEQPAKPIEKAILTFYITTPAREKAEAEGITVIMPEQG